MDRQYRRPLNYIVIGTGVDGRQFRLHAEDIALVVAEYGKAHAGIHRACKWFGDAVEALHASVDAWEADPTVAGADVRAMESLEGALDDARRLLRRRKQGGAS